MTIYNVLVLGSIAWVIIGWIIFNILDVYKYGTARATKLLAFSLLAGGPILVFLSIIRLIYDWIFQFDIRKIQEDFNDWLEK